MLTLRERIKGSPFMTWASDSPQTAPLNLELPLVALGTSGLTARLEFNWIDDMGAALRDALAPRADPQWQNPIFLASCALDLSFEGARPVLEHTTFREKFAICRPAADELEDVVFDVNIDNVVAQALETGVTGSFVDVDISPRGLVGAPELERLARFVVELSSRFDLKPLAITKAWRGAMVAALLG
jgi:hypothetical protein